MFESSLHICLHVSLQMIRNSHLFLADVSFNLICSNDVSKCLRNLISTHFSFVLLSREPQMTHSCAWKLVVSVWMRPHQRDSTSSYVHHLFKKPSRMPLGKLKIPRKIHDFPQTPWIFQCSKECRKLTLITYHYVGRMLLARRTLEQINVENSLQYTE